MPVCMLALGEVAGVLMATCDRLSKITLFSPQTSLCLIQSAHHVTEVI